MHRQFVHPSVNKIYDLLKRALPAETNKATLKTPKHLTQRCNSCQRIYPEPVQFCVFLCTEELCFNGEIFIYIMYISQKAILHIVDAATKFSATRLLANLITVFVWAAFEERWGSIYTGLLNRVCLDRGSCFEDDFYTVVSDARIDIGRLGTEVHTSLCIRERFHQPLRNKFYKTNLSMAKHMPYSTILSISVQAMNDTLRLKYLCCRLLFLKHAVEILKFTQDMQTKWLKSIVINVWTDRSDRFYFC